MVKRLSLVIICILAIFITIIGSVIYIYLYKKTEALNTQFIWCHDNWKCKAPENSAALNDFNLLYPNSCDGANCIEGEEYNVYDKGPLSSDFKDKCDPDVELTDDNFAVVDKITGCLCRILDNNDYSDLNTCKVDDLTTGTIENCAPHKCGIIRKPCATYKIKPTLTNIGDEIYNWTCDRSADPGDGDPTRLDVREFCSYMCQPSSNVADVTSNTFYNNFIFGLKK